MQLMYAFWDVQVYKYAWMNPPSAEFTPYALWIPSPSSLLTMSNLALVVHESSHHSAKW
jgi:hypothetical protein